MTDGTILALRGARQRATAVGLLALALCLGAGPARGQDEAPPPVAAPSLSVDMVQSRLAELDARADLSPEVKATARDVWAQVLLQVQQVDDARGTAAEWEAARVEVPTRLADVRAQLEAALPAPPPPPDDADLAQLEQRLADAQAQFAVADRQVKDLELERKQRTDRRVAIPRSLTDARQRLESLPAPTTAVDPASPVDDARAALVLATRMAIEARLDSDAKELSSYDARSELLRARQDLTSRRLAAATALVQVRQERVERRRRFEAEAAERQAEATKQEAGDAEPVVRDLAAGNVAMAERRTKLIAALKRRGDELEDVRAEAQRLDQQTALVHSRVDRVGFTNSVAVLLLRHQTVLPDLRTYRKLLDELQDETAAVELESLDLEDEREGLGSLDAAVQHIIGGTSASTDPMALGELSLAVRPLLEQRRTLLDNLLDDVDTYLDRLIELELEVDGLIHETVDYQRFIAENVLWVRSAGVFGARDVADTAGALAWLLDPGAWAGTGAALLDDTVTRPGTLVALVALLVLLVLMRASRQRLRRLSDDSARRRLLSARSMLAVLGYTLVLTLWLPVVLWLASWRLGASLGPPQGAALGMALGDMALVVLPLTFLKSVCRAHGLGEGVLKWAGASTRALRRSVRLLALVMVPALLVAAMMRYSLEESYDRSLGRIAIVVAWVMLALVASRMLRLGGPLQKVVARQPRGWVARLRAPGRLLALVLPLALALATLAGFLYAGHEVGRRLLHSWTLVLGLIVVHGMVMRWLTMQRRSLRLEQAQRRREAQGGDDPTGSSDASGELPAVIEETETELDLATVDAQVQQLVRFAVGFALLLGMGLVWIDVLPALGALDRVVLWTTGAPAAEGALPTALAVVSLADLLLALWVLVLTIVAAKNLPGLLEISLLRRLPLEPGGGYAITTLCRYFITIVGLVVSLGMVGITWQSVQFLAAAITVGLGFGLQEIFANFVSGLMILFERPVRVGDIVTVGGVDGVVTRIRMRATTIRDWDRRELLVPNKEFITSQLINWTLSDPVTRVIFTIGLAYGSDTEKATTALQEIARAQPLVLDSPEPSVVFRRFGESTLDFDLRIFIANRETWPAVTHDINTRIDKRFKQEGIEIAFPQRDLHVRTFGAAVRLEPTPAPTVSPPVTPPATTTDPVGTVG